MAACEEVDNPLNLLVRIEDRLVNVVRARAFQPVHPRIELVGVGANNGWARVLLMLATVAIPGWPSIRV